MTILLGRLFSLFHRFLFQRLSALLPVQTQELFVRDGVLRDHVFFVLLHANAVQQISDGILPPWTGFTAKRHDIWDPASSSSQPEASHPPQNRAALSQATTGNGPQPQLVPPDIEYARRLAAAGWETYRHGSRFWHWHGSILHGMLIVPSESPRPGLRRRVCPRRGFLSVRDRRHQCPPAGQLIPPALRAACPRSLRAASSRRPLWHAAAFLRLLQCPLFVPPRRTNTASSRGPV